MMTLMTGAKKKLAPQSFTPPPGITSAKIDPASGLLAAPGAGNAIDEVFLDGTVPTTQAPSSGENSPDTYLLEQN